MKQEKGIKITLKYKLIDIFDSWIEYNEARNKILYTYDDI